MKTFRAILVSIFILLLVLGAGCEYIFLTETPVPQTPTSTPSPINPSFTPLPTGGSATPNVTLTPSPSPTSAPVLLDFADIVARVKPSVVSINTEVTDVFGTAKGAGSGWVIAKEGLILTNYHVIEGALKVSVTFDNGDTYEAKTIRGDAISDLAVLDIGVPNLPAAKIGDSSKTKVGNFVLAIGNALGEGISATFGIISLTGVSLQVSQSETLYNLLATDAPVNPGNSGGPLVNMAGEVIGITSAKLASVEVEGRGYAIPTNTAIPIVNELIQKGYVIRPWLGVTVDNVNQFYVLRYGLGTSSGAFLTEVSSASPAQAAGLQKADVIVSFGGKEIKNASELVAAIRGGQIGQSVDITYWRGKEKKNTTAVLKESPPP